MVNFLKEDNFAVVIVTVGTGKCFVDVNLILQIVYVFRSWLVRKAQWLCTANGSVRRVALYGE